MFESILRKLFYRLYKGHLKITIVRYHGQIIGTFELDDYALMCGFESEKNLDG